MEESSFEVTNRELAVYKNFANHGGSRDEAVSDSVRIVFSFATDKIQQLETLIDSGVPFEVANELRQTVANSLEEAGFFFVSEELAEDCGTLAEIRSACSEANRPVEKKLIDRMDNIKSSLDKAESSQIEFQEWNGVQLFDTAQSDSKCITPDDIDRNVRWTAETYETVNKINTQSKYVMYKVEGLPYCSCSGNRFSTCYHQAAALHSLRAGRDFCR